MVAGFGAIGAVYYAAHGRKVFRAPALPDNELAVPDLAKEGKESATTRVVEADKDSGSSAIDV